MKTHSTEEQAAIDKSRRYVQSIQFNISDVVEHVDPLTSSARIQVLEESFQRREAK